MKKINKQESIEFLNNLIDGKLNIFTDEFYYQYDDHRRILWGKTEYFDLLDRADKAYAKQLNLPVEIDDTVIRFDVCIHTFFDVNFNDHTVVCATYFTNDLRSGFSINQRIWPFCDLKKCIEALEEEYDINDIVDIIRCLENLIKYARYKDDESQYSSVASFWEYLLNPCYASGHND